MEALSSSLELQGRDQEASRVLQRALEGQDAMDVKNVASIKQSLSRVYLSLDEADRALVEIQEAYDILTDASDSGQELLQCGRLLATTLHRCERFQDAFAIVQGNLRLSESLSPETDNLGDYQVLVNICLAWEFHAGTASVISTLFEGADCKLRAAAHTNTLVDLRWFEAVGEWYTKLGYYHEASMFIFRASEGLTTILGPKHYLTLSSRCACTRALLFTGDFTGALDWGVRLLNFCSEEAEPASSPRAVVMQDLMIVSVCNGLLGNACTLSKEMIDGAESSVVGDHTSEDVVPWQKIYHQLVYASQNRGHCRMEFSGLLPILLRLDFMADREFQKRSNRGST